MALNRGNVIFKQCEVINKEESVIIVVFFKKMASFLRYIYTQNRIFNEY